MGEDPVRAVLLIGAEGVAFEYRDKGSNRPKFATDTTSSTGTRPASSAQANVSSATYFFKSAVQFKMTLICCRSGASGNEGTRKRLPLPAGV